MCLSGLLPYWLLLPCALTHLRYYYLLFLACQIPILIPRKDSNFLLPLLHSTTPNCAIDLIAAKSGAKRAARAASRLVRNHLRQKKHVAETFHTRAPSVKFPSGKSEPASFGNYLLFVLKRTGTGTWARARARARSLVRSSIPSQG